MDRRRFDDFVGDRVFLTATDVAELLHLHILTVYRSAREGRIPSMKKHGHRLFPVEELWDYIEHRGGEK